MTVTNSRRRNSKPGQPTSEHVREVAEATDVMAEEFFAPLLALLFSLLEHPLPGVRVYVTTILGDVVVGHMPAFTVEPLAEVAFRLKTLSEQDADPRVRACAAAQLEKVMDSAVAYGAACKAAKHATNGHNST